LTVDVVDNDMGESEVKLDIQPNKKSDKTKPEAATAE
jgi:ATP-dependent Clp protease ATP-binding subunit ClpA